MYAPIVMFVYNRADHFIRTFDALARCPEASESDLFIFSDGAKNDAGAAGVEAVRRAAKEKIALGLFKSAELIESPVNRGLAASVISGVTRVMDEYGRAIVVEDDCVASPYLLSFFDRALDYYEDDTRVGSIAGFTPAFDFPESFGDDVFFSYRSCSWGWAAYKRSWDGVDWEMKDAPSFFRDRKLMERFASGGSDRVLRLYRQSRGEGNSWSVRFGAHLVKNDMLTVYPRYSYIQNIGCDDSGVHSAAEDAKNMSVDLSLSLPRPEFTEPYIDPAVQKAFASRYSGGPVTELKRGLAAALITAKSRLFH